MRIDRYSNKIQVELEQYKKNLIRIINIAKTMANKIIWISYGFTYIIGGILSLLFNTNIGGIIVAISSTLGIIILITVYNRIYQKYKK